MLILRTSVIHVDYDLVSTLGFSHSQNVLNGGAPLQKVDERSIDLLYLSSMVDGLVC